MEGLFQWYALTSPFSTPASHNSLFYPALPLLPRNHEHLMEQALTHGLQVLTEDGECEAFGRNFYGQLGDRTTRPKKLPEKVKMSNITMVSCGGRHSMIAVKGRGLWTFGANYNGQLGLPCKDSIPTPTQIKGFIA